MVNRRMTLTHHPHKTNEGVPTVSLPPHAVAIKFIVDDHVVIVHAYPNHQQYKFDRDVGIELWVTSEEENDSDSFRRQAYFSMRSF